MLCHYQLDLPFPCLLIKLSFPHAQRVYMFILYPLQSEHIEAIQYSFIKLKQNPVFALGSTVKALPVIFHYVLCRELFFLHLNWCLMKGCPASRPYLLIQEKWRPEWTAGGEERQAWRKNWGATGSLGYLVPSSVLVGLYSA